MINEMYKQACTRLCRLFLFLATREVVWSGFCLYAPIDFVLSAWPLHLTRKPIKGKWQQREKDYLLKKSSLSPRLACMHERLSTTTWHANLYVLTHTHILTHTLHRGTNQIAYTHTRQRTHNTQSLYQKATCRRERIRPMDTHLDTLATMGVVSCYSRFRDCIHGRFRGMNRIST